MKRVVCIIVLICVLPVTSFAIDISDFNDYLAVFGVDELKEGTFDGKYTVYTVGDCTLYFLEKENDLIIYVSGDGGTALALTSAAIMFIEEDNTTFEYNSGVLLSNYLLSRTGEQHTAFTKNGNLILIVPQETGYMFAVNRK